MCLVFSNLRRSLLHSDELQRTASVSLCIEGEVGGQGSDLSYLVPLWVSRSLCPVRFLPIICIHLSLLSPQFPPFFWSGLPLLLVVPSASHWWLMESAYWPLVNSSSDTLNILMTSECILGYFSPPIIFFRFSHCFVLLLRAATGSCMLYFSPLEPFLNTL